MPSSVIEKTKYYKEGIDAGCLRLYPKIILSYRSLQEYDCLVQFNLNQCDNGNLQTVISEARWATRHARVVQQRFPTSTACVDHGDWSYKEVSVCEWIIVFNCDQSRHLRGVLTEMGVAQVRLIPRDDRVAQSWQCKTMHISRANSGELILLLMLYDD